LANQLSLLTAPLARAEKRSRVRQSLESFAQGRLAELANADRLRHPQATARPDARSMVRDNRTLVDFSSNDYLGLSRDTQVVAAARQALEGNGAGAGASRLITGEHPGYAALETEIAALKGTEDAVVFGSGFLANMGILSTLLGRSDLLIADRLNHASLVDGARLTGAKVLRTAHADPEAVAARLDRHRGEHRHCLIATDGVFSMDGDLAPLPELARLAEEHDCWLMSDDAHGVGVVGGGAGSTAALGLSASDVPLQMGTLSKAVGAYGGYLAASRAVTDLIRAAARPLIYTTALPPATVAAAAAAIRRIRQDGGLCARPLALARRFAEQLGLPEPASPIVPVVLGDDRAALDAQAALAEAGFGVQAIRPPTVPEGSARLRVTLRAPQHESDVDALARALAPYRQERAVG
jgi:8-amino-7-oxononanoate synthase